MQIPLLGIVLQNSIEIVEGGLGVEQNRHFLKHPGNIRHIWFESHTSSELLLWGTGGYEWFQILDGLTVDLDDISESPKGQLSNLILPSPFRTLDYSCNYCEQLFNDGSRIGIHIDWFWVPRDISWVFLCQWSLHLNIQIWLITQ